MPVIFFMARKNKPYGLDLVRRLSAYELDYLVAVKAYLQLNTYDDLAVVFHISAHSWEGRGATAQEVSADLGFSRSTVNRILARLLQSKNILVIEDTWPRQYIINNGFTEHFYQEGASEARTEIYRKYMRKYSRISRIIIEELTIGQID